MSVKCVQYYTIYYGYTGEDIGNIMAHSDYDVTNESVPLLSTNKSSMETPLLSPLATVTSGTPLYNNDTSAAIIEFTYKYNSLETARWYLSSIINPLLCSFGIVGNILNMIVLSRKRFSVAMDTGMEKAAVAGMLALAISDMLFCISAMPSAFVGHQSALFSSRNFVLLYQTYSKGIKTIFTHTSTWFTVLLATARYIAICHPLQARLVLDLKMTLMTIIALSVFCVLISLPVFWEVSMLEFECPEDNLQLFVTYPGDLTTNTCFKTTMTYVWFIIGFVIPVCLLTYCNVNLIMALRKSFRMRKQFMNVRMRSQNGTGSGNTGSNITPTLVAVVIVFTVLVAPADICSFMFYVINHPSHTENFLFAIELTNVMKTLNFSINFLLYCAVNKKFRNSLRDIFQCRMLGFGRQYSTDSNATQKSFSFTKMTAVPNGRMRSSSFGRNDYIGGIKEDKTSLNGCLVKLEKATYL